MVACSDLLDRGSHTIRYELEEIGLRFGRFCLPVKAVAEEGLGDVANERLYCSVESFPPPLRREECCDLWRRMWERHHFQVRE